MARERYRRALVDVAAGAPAPDGLEAHLASCGACREELATLRGAVAVADREMGRLLSLKPSPELAARIRRAVAEPDARPVPRPRWTWPAVAAAVALVMALVLVAGRDPSARPGAAGASAQAPGGASATDAEAGAGRPKPSSGTRRAEAGEQNDATVPLVQEGVVPAGSRLGPRRAIPPEVLIPPGEAEALLRFAADLQRRTVTPDSLLVSDLSVALSEPKDLEIEPIEIVPLDPAETSGTD